LADGIITASSPTFGFHFGKVKLLPAVVPDGSFTEDDVPRDDVERRILSDDALRPGRKHVDFDFQVIQRSVHQSLLQIEHPLAPATGERVGVRGKLVVHPVHVFGENAR
jgi:hypothetical protein